MGAIVKQEMPRCAGTQRGKCGYPLRTKLELMRNHCSACFIEWLDSLIQITVIYHKNCYDGYGAAWVFNKRFPNIINFVAANYGDDFPNLPLTSNIFIVDFSYPRSILERARLKYLSLTILDHHKTAEADLTAFPNAIFDMQRSGAMLSWDYLYAPEQSPALISYIQDQDLWRLKLPYSKEVLAALRSYRMDFSTWNGLEHMIPQLKSDGIAILRQQDMVVEIMCNNATMRNIAGFKIPVTNATCYFSEVGEALCIRYPHALFAAYYLDRNDEKRQWGLRAINDDFDVSIVAKKYGGGGHKNAAGFTTPLNWLGE